MVLTKRLPSSNVGWVLERWKFIEIPHNFTTNKGGQFLSSSFQVKENI
jgi:hypothetical protein